MRAGWRLPGAQLPHARGGRPRAETRRTFRQAPSKRDYAQNWLSRAKRCTGDRRYSRSPGAILRRRFTSPRRFFRRARASRSRRGTFVAVRCSTGRDAASTSRRKRSSAAARFASCVRPLRASMRRTPSDVMRRPASSRNCSFTARGSVSELATSRRRRTAVETLLTFCPPGPVERNASKEISPGAGCHAQSGGIPCPSGCPSMGPSAASWALRAALYCPRSRCASPPSAPSSDQRDGPTQQR